MHTPSTCGRRKEPHPVRTNADAVRLFTIAACVPLQHEILGLALDRGGRAVDDRIYIISDTVEPDAVLRVTELLACVGEGSPYSRLVVASVRPDGGLLPDDIDRWLEASQIAEGRGASLVEWYVIHAGGIDCPRELLGEPPRW